MTIPISFPLIETSEVTKGFSRYKNQRVIYYGENNFITFNIYRKKNYVQTGEEKVMLITKGVEYRPDLGAYEVYGMPDAWWKILEANNMKDILEFKAGVTIVIPGLGF